MSTTDPASDSPRVGVYVRQSVADSPTPRAARHVQTILLIDPNGEPLDPYAAETHDGVFWALRLGSHHAARIVPNYPPRGARGDAWAAQGPRGSYGTVERLEGDEFRPLDPQGVRRIVQGSLIDALARILPA